MLFNLFGKKKTIPAPQFDDLVFISQPAKQAAVIAFAKQHPDSIFIAWFENTALLFREIFTLYDLNTARIEEAKYFIAAKYTGRQILFLEHYPLRAKEDALVQHCLQPRFTVYNSLTEPLFTQFGGERIIEVMRRFGMNANEPLQHKMISRSLEKAQKKIAGKIALEQPAGSQEEWMRRNIPTAKE